MGYGVPAQVLTRYITGVETRGGRPRLVRGGLSLGKTRSSDSDHSLREVIPVASDMVCVQVRGGLCVEVRGAVRMTSPCHGRV